jgi:rfaE bifunctional protein nucleotidyltransferase chain/domain
MKHTQKFVHSHKELIERVKAHKTLGHKIVCTIGSWDMLHIGHLRYLNAAKEHGDVLIVGVDSDRGIKSYKGPLRPVIPESERAEMLSYQDCVDYVTLVDDIDEKGNWQYEIIKDLPIDVFVAVEGNSYTDEQKKVIEKLCPELAVIPRQALSTSSTDIIQNVIKIHLLDQLERLKDKKK